MAHIGFDVPAVGLMNNLRKGAIRLQVSIGAKQRHEVVHGLIHRQLGQQLSGAFGPNHVRHGSPNILCLGQIGATTSPVRGLGISQVEHISVPRQ
eukprot:Skav233028  [mRNA]  locus=scaffold909:717263:724656:+ [translate_table: standard]